MSKSWLHNLPKAAKCFSDDPRERRFLLNLTDDILSRFPNLTMLDMSAPFCPRLVTDRGLKYLRHLRKLIVDGSRISFQGLQHLTSSLVSLSFSGSSSLTDNELCQFSCLTHLSIILNNQISDLGVSSLTTLVSLSVLRSTPRITEAALTSLSRLKELQLSNNETVDLSSPVFRDVFSRITTLRIDGACDFRSLPHFVHLRTLQIASVPSWTTSPPPPLSTLTNLTTLTLFNVNVSDLKLDTLPTLSELSIIGGTSVTDRILSNLSGLRSLSVIQNRYISDLGIRPLTSLVNLSLGDVPHVGKSLAHLTNLKSLYISALTKADDLSLAPLTNLTSLTMSNVTFTDAALLPLVRLQRLVLSRTKNLTVDGIVRLTGLTSLSVSERHYVLAFSALPQCDCVCPGYF